ncbi:MAG: hypothetical protein H7A23_18780 [Leptospiraceae bacterium]|nr:hypothetical protein [Leptospiraceae bacterium]
MSSQIIVQTHNKLAIDAALFGSIFIMALYHFSFYLHRKKDKTSLYFGFFCLTASIYVISANEALIYIFFPTIPFRLAYILLFVYYLAVPLYVSFVSDRILIQNHTVDLVTFFVRVYIRNTFKFGNRNRYRRTFSLCCSGCTVLCSNDGSESSY